MPVKELKAYKVQSDSDPNVWYQVILDTGSSAGVKCTCKDFIFRRRFCKHIERAVTAYLYGL